MSTDQDSGERTHSPTRIAVTRTPRPTLPAPLLGTAARAEPAAVAAALGGAVTRTATATVIEVRRPGVGFDVTYDHTEWAVNAGRASDWNADHDPESYWPDDLTSQEFAPAHADLADVVAAVQRALDELADCNRIARHQAVARPTPGPGAAEDPARPGPATMLTGRGLEERD